MIWPLKPNLVDFQETKKNSFSKNFLKNLRGNRNFEWNFLASIGSAGGILVGVDVDLFDIISWESKFFFLSVWLLKTNRLSWYLGLLYYYLWFFI